MVSSETDLKKGWGAFLRLKNIWFSKSTANQFKVYKCTGQMPILDKVIIRQLTWIGHMLRREKKEPIRIYGLYEPKRELGTTKKRAPCRKLRKLHRLSN